MTNTGFDVLLTIDVQGAVQVMRKLKRSVNVFVLPPSMKELKKRLVGRGTDSSKVVQGRFKEARNELTYAKRYDYVIVNNVLNDAVKDVMKIIDVEKMKVPHNEEMIHGLCSTRKNG